MQVGGAGYVGQDGLGRAGWVSGSGCRCRWVVQGRLVRVGWTGWVGQGGLGRVVQDGWGVRMVGG